jgi:hypothetical protein
MSEYIVPLAHLRMPGEESVFLLKTYICAVSYDCNLGNRTCILHSLAAPILVQPIRGVQRFVYGLYFIKYAVLFSSTHTFVLLVIL